MSGKHKHRPVWVMGSFPVAAKCKGCPMRLIANGGGWVSPEEARDLQRARGGFGAAL